MSRRIEALKNLAERGATEGEREAARKALEIHLRKAGEPERSQTPFRPNTSAGNEHADFLNKLFRNFYATAPPFAHEPPFKARCWEPFESGPKAKTYRTSYSETMNADFITVDDDSFAEDTTPTPPKTWPEAVDVDDHPTEQARARLEVATRAEMFSRFRESKPVTIRWRSHVWRTEGFAGTCEDKSSYPPRFYLTINTARLTRL